MDDEYLLLNDDELVRLLAEGDDKAFEVLFARHYKQLFNFIYCYIGNYHLAEDLLQETFMRIIESARRYKAQKKFVPYLYTIARNLCRDLARRKETHNLSIHATVDEKRGSSEFVDFICADEQTPYETVAENEMHQRLYEAIARLPKAQREALLLKKFAGMSYEEIAKQQGQSVSAAKMRVHRAIKRLRKLLGENLL